MQGFFRPRALAIFAAESALSPEEWIAVRRADVDRTQGVVRVERTAVDGEEKPYDSIVYVWIRCQASESTPASRTRNPRV